MRALLRIDPVLCHMCDRCQARAHCRIRAIAQFERGDLPVIESQRCMGCQACIPSCPHGAITVEGRPPAVAPPDPAG